MPDASLVTVDLAAVLDGEFVIERLAEPDSAELRASLAERVVFSVPARLPIPKCVVSAVSRRRTIVLAAPDSPGLENPRHQRDFWEVGYF